MEMEVKGMGKGYKMTELGKIPVEWEVKKLLEVSDRKGEYGLGASAIDYSPDKPRYLRITDIDENGRLSNYDVRGFDGENYENYVLDEGDILFARTGNTTGKSYLYRKSDGPLVFAGFLIRFRINQRISDAKYIFYYVQTKKYWDWVNKMSVRSGQPGINSNEYANLLIPFPPRHEQQKIAEILSTVDEQIENTDQLIKKTKELKKGLMQQLLTKGIGHTEFKKTELGEIPVGWEVLPLDNVLQQMTDYVANGSFQSLRENVRVYDEKKYAMYVRLYDLRLGLGHPSQKYVDQKSFEFLSKSFLCGNEVLIANIGANVGEVFLMQKLTYPATIAPNMIVMRVDSKHSYQYVYFYLSSEIGQSVIASEISGSGQPKLNKTGLKRVKIAVPDYKEQQKIAEILSAVDEQIESYEQEKEKYIELKKGLMQQLLTGKIRVTL